MDTSKPKPIHTAVEEVRHLHEIERAGEGQWTPVIALGGLIAFLLAVGVVMFGIVEGLTHLLASAR